MIKVLFVCRGTPVYYNAELLQSGEEYGKIWRKALEILPFRRLSHMGRIGIKANVLGEIFSSNGLLKDDI